MSEQYTKIMSIIDNLQHTHTVHRDPSTTGVVSYLPKRKLNPPKPYVPCPKVKFARLIAKLIRSRPDDPDYVPGPPPVGFKGIHPAPKLFKEMETSKGVTYMVKC